jgi:cytochrome P450 family 142 subfamily A polypeptide 1
MTDEREPRPLIRLLDGAFYAGDPFRAYRWMRRHEPVYWDEEGRVWGITRHADVMHVSAHPELFCSAGGSRPDAEPFPTMINFDNPQHNLRRSLVNKGFTPRRVAEHEGFLRATVTGLIDAVLPAGRCDFVEALAAPLPMIMIGTLLGFVPEDREKLQRWSDDMVAGTAADVPDEVAAAAAIALVEYREHFDAIVADRRAHPRDDLMSILANAADESGERIDDYALLHESLLLLIGGNETTRNVISAAMEQLIRHPDQRRKLVADPGKIPLAVEEFLRWGSPIVNMNRTATGDVELRGRTLHAGDKLLLLYPSANRDEEVFADPDRFDVERDPNPHVAFGGHGAHHCLGANLARLEIRVMFEELLRRMPEATLAAGAQVSYTPSNFVRGIHTLPIEFPASRP